MLTDGSSQLSEDTRNQIREKWTHNHLLAIIHESYLQTELTCDVQVIYYF